MNIMLKIILIILVSIPLIGATPADSTLTVIRVHETAGLDRDKEYLEIPLQLNYVPLDTERYSAVDEEGNRTECQVVLRFASPDNKISQLSLIFPVSLSSYTSKKIYLKKTQPGKEHKSLDLQVYGEATELIIESKYYRADLTRSSQSAAKNYASGQLRELLIKMDINQLLFRTENRMHWAPNFQKQGAVDYKTMAQWNRPGFNQINKGPYLVKTTRQAPAPDHPEIMLTATYKFYADKPYFIFYSEMDIVTDVILVLLRNDEMTMDSMFTHVACKRHNGDVENLTFAERNKFLSTDPVENDAAWICFYNEDKNFGFGSIRIKYDNSNRFGDPSPLFMPHTKISDGADGGKYWNRRLIHDHPTLVPAGSRYMEENAYIVFRIDQRDRFETLDYWSQRLRNPIIWNIMGTADQKF
jgi:hypothetical protein